jgi:DNA-binding NarL/FixJ family response regulator
MESPYRIVIADDHVLFRHGIRSIVSANANLEVIGEVGDGIELLNILKKIAPDMVVLDISMPNMRGLEVAVEIKKRYPQIKILILTMHRNKEYVYHAISIGVSGYLLKENADKDLFLAIDAIRKGGIYISPLLSNELILGLVNTRTGGRQGHAGSLTTREKEILKLIAEGKSSKEIAALLFISVRTVEYHRYNMMKRLSLRNTADLVTYAVREGYLSETD